MKNKFIDELYSNNITNQTIINFLIGYFILYILIFPFREWLESNNYIPSFVKTQYFCFSHCSIDNKTCNKMCKLKDESYFNRPVKDFDKCIFNMWELAHILFHVNIGYYLNIYWSLACNVLFEIFEHYHYDCGSVMDLFYNQLGFTIGYSLRYIV